MSSSRWVEKPEPKSGQVKQLPRYQMKAPGNMTTRPAVRKLVPKPNIKKK